MTSLFRLIATAILFSAAHTAFAADAAVAAGKSSGADTTAGYGPYLDRGYAQQVLWGDTHVHTAFSVDAALTGNRLPPETAYRFARGETVTASNGLQARLININKAYSAPAH